jgi:uncharacterized protein (DUF302 family)
MKSFMGVMGAVAIPFFLPRHVRRRTGAILPVIDLGHTGRDRAGTRKNRLADGLRRFVLLAIAIGLISCASQRTTPQDSFYEVETSKPYGDVLAELEVAITEQNFRITGHNHIGSVIRTRDNIPFPDYDAIQFCSLTLARRMLEISPAAVSYMPCNITVRSERGKVIVATHLLPASTGNSRLDDFFRVINGKLKTIVKFAAEQ